MSDGDSLSWAGSTDGVPSSVNAPGLRGVVIGAMPATGGLLSTTSREAVPVWAAGSVTVSCTWNRPARV